MKNYFVEFIILLLVTLVISAQPVEQSATLNSLDLGQCQESKNGQQLCRCGEENLIYDRLRGEECLNGKIVQSGSQQGYGSSITGLRSTGKPVHRSTRDDNADAVLMGLRIKSKIPKSLAFVPLRSVSVEAWIHSFVADVTLTQVFVNREEKPIEAIYVFPIEENAAVYNFTAQIDDRLITAILKEKKLAEAEYTNAVQQGETAVLLRQSEQTLDTFTINVGALPPGKECRVKIQYVTELDLVDENSIRFVVPTTVAPRYNPKMGALQSPESTKAEYIQNTSYSISFRAHVDRDPQYDFTQVANRSHPVNVSVLHDSIDVSFEATALDRDIILDIDLPKNRSSVLIAVEQYNSTKQAILTAFTPNRAQVAKILGGKNETNSEFIFIVDCSGSMWSEDRIGLARQAMLLFVRSLPVGSRFNIIRFGTDYNILFPDEELTAVYNEQTAKKAEELSRSMQADLGGTRLLQPLQYLKDHPPSGGRSRQVFLLTDGEISNTDEVIELCRSMSSNTRIFSFGLGYSSSRSLVKGLARATNGQFVFIPPNVKVDMYVGTQLQRAMQPSLVNAQLAWYGLSSNGSQAPSIIPPLYVNDRVLVYTLLEDDNWDRQAVQVDFLIGDHQIGKATLNDQVTRKADTIHRLAAKALIQQLQHQGQDARSDNGTTVEQRITKLSLTHQILSPYTAFVGVETSSTKKNVTAPERRYVPIQISKGDEHLFAPIQYRPRFQQQFPMMNGGGFGGRYRGARLKSEARPSSSISGDALTTFASMQINSDSEASDKQSANIKDTSLAADPVRWLIEHQTFNGAWPLNDDEVQQLTKGKMLAVFESTVSKDKDILTAALAIAVLESKHADQQKLWFALVQKGRKRLLDLGLSQDKIDLLINEIKNKL